MDTETAVFSASRLAGICGSNLQMYQGRAPMEAG